MHRSGLGSLTNSGSDCEKNSANSARSSNSAVWRTASRVSNCQNALLTRPVGISHAPHRDFRRRGLTNGPLASYAYLPLVPASTSHLRPSEIPAMAASNRLTGIFTPNLVPLDGRGEINEAELRRYV